jgi:hypothetical protein
MEENMMYDGIRLYYLCGFPELNTVFFHAPERKFMLWKLTQGVSKRDKALGFGGMEDWNHTASCVM